MRRWQIVLGRWISLILCGLTAATVWILLEPVLSSTATRVVFFLGELRPEFLAIAIIVASISILGPLGRGRWKGLLGLRHLGTYPPLWIATAVGLFLVVGYRGITVGWDAVTNDARTTASFIRLLPWWMFLVLAALVFVPFALATGTGNPGSRRGRRSNTRDVAQPATFSPDDILEWIQDDREISHPDDDLFDHDPIAQRIASRLSCANGEAPIIAVVGPLGSGKTSIGCLVAHHLNKHSHVGIVSVSLWPFESAEAAVAGILRAVIHRLSAHVNTLSLAGLSERYVQTIERIGGRWGIMVNKAAYRVFLTRTDEHRSTR